LRQGLVRRVSRSTVLVATAIACAVAPRARAQEFPTLFRGDEVGPREIDLDEEAFLNLLSFEQPLESVQPFLAADSGWYTTLGSLLADTLWYQQDFKYRAPISDTLAARAAIRNAVDLDTDFTQIQVTPELLLSDRWTAGIPAVLGADKGTLDGGLAFTYRDPAAGVDFLRLQWVRSDLVFGQRTDRFPKSEVKRPADNLELQWQGVLFGLGRTTLVLADEMPSKVDFVETQRVDEFARFTARVLHAVEVDEKQRGFLDARYEIARERSTPTGPLGAPDAFDGDRDLFSTRVEYQRDLDDDHVRRWRFGAQYLYLREDADAPAQPALDHSDLRREVVAYAGYRTPLETTSKVDLETVVYVDRLRNVHRYPNDPREDGHDPVFQGKISFYFRWHISQRAEFVIDPTFELDQFGWGGGGVMLRCRM